MPDNVAITPGAGANIATDDIGGVNYQRVKLTLGADGVDNGDVASGNPLPVTGPLTDAQLRASAVPVSGTVTANTGLTQPLTDAQLRASAVPISGTVTITDGSGPITIDGTVAVTGPLTDAQLRASAVPISGAVTISSGSVTISDGSGPVTVDGTVNTVEQSASLTGQAAQTAIVNNILESTAGSTGTDVTNFRAMSVQVVSTATGGTFVFEQSNDNTNWVALPVFNAALVTGVPITAAITATVSQIIYTFPVRCRFVRLRIASTITGGSIQAHSRISTEPWTAAAQLVASNTAANLLAQVSGTVTANAGTGTLAVSMATNTPTLAAGTNRAAFFAAAGIWYDDSAATLAGNATFTGTSRDATLTASATAWANAATYAGEIRISAESDVTGTLWLEVSRDNTNWRRAKSVATTAVTGGGQYAEIIHRPSWRYWRVGYTNGATVQARFSIGSIAQAA